jgi:hypothetical protein
MREEWKWVKPTNTSSNPGTPVWSYGGIVCTETYKNVVKLTFARELH